VRQHLRGRSVTSSHKELVPTLAIAAMLAVLLAAALVPSAALAVETHNLKTTFGPFTNPSGIGIDTASGNVFVAAGGPENSVNILGSEGGAPSGVTATKIEGFAFAGEPSGVAIDNSATSPSKGALYVTDVQHNAVKKYALNGGAYEFKSALGAAPEFHEPLGVAVNAKGTVYVANYSPAAVVVFSPTGIETGRIDLSTVGSPSGLALDAAGNLYVQFYGNGKVLRFAANGSGEVEPTTVPTEVVAGGATGLAVDQGSGVLYVAMGDHLAQYSSAGVFELEFGAGTLGFTRRVAVGSSGDIYVSDSGRADIALFDGDITILPDVTTEAATAVKKNSATLNGIVSAAGGPEASCQFQYTTETKFQSEGFSGAAITPCTPPGPFTGSGAEPVSAMVGGLGSDTAYRFRVVSSSEKGDSQGAALAFATPKAVNLQTGVAANLTGAGATLNGTIDPEGVELEECKFEYGTDTSYGQTVPCAESPAAIGSGEGPVPVHADVSGLSGGTTYHFRLAAKNSLGAISGADASFLTLGPVIAGESFSHVADTSATLEAIINPEGDATGYFFEYVTQAKFEAGEYDEATSLPESGGAVGSGTEAVEVSQQPGDLMPGTTYHFRVVAVNASGTVEGADMTFTTFTPTPSFPSCPANEAFRTFPSDALPDCRAYEQVSPVDKNSGDVSGDKNRFEASSDGNAATFFVNGGMPGGVGAQDFPFYLARRDAGAWSTRGVLPPPSLGRIANISGWTPDLEYFFTQPWIPGVNEKYVVRNSKDSSFTVISESEEEGFHKLVDVSADGSKVFFLVYGPGGPTFYVWNRDTNAINIVGVLPEDACGSPPCAAPSGSLGGAYNWFGATSNATSGEHQEEHVASTTGDQAIFTDVETRQLYLRKNPAGPSATTVPVSASQRATPDPGGTQPAAFLRATPSGSVVFFLSCEKLTDDSTAYSSVPNNCAPNETGVEGEDLYAYETASGDLTDLTVDSSGDPRGADVQGVIGASDDGSYVYFAANGDLDGSGPAELGNCRFNKGIDESPIGSCNVYLAHAGAITFIAHIDATRSIDRGGVSNWKVGNPVLSFEQKTGRVSADGKTLLFDSQTELTPNAEGTQFYRYHVGDPGLICITCDPTGNGAGGGDLQNVAPTSQSGPDSSSPVLTRNLSADGSRVFFETAAKLVVADTNGDGGCPMVGYWPRPACQDVYEWEENGRGSCQSSAQNGGCLYLLSTGVSSEPAFFGDASASGDNVFIFTRETLVPQDKDGIRDLYDVRVNGGLASQHPESPPTCEAEACRGAGTSPPPASGAASAVFQGDGNPPIKRHHKKKHHKKKHHKEHKKSAHKRAGQNRGGAK
jgi:hypothetical protein